MSHDFSGKNIGIGLTGSYCTYAKIFEEIEKLSHTNANLTTIFSAHAASTDSRFGECSFFLKRAE